MDRCFVQTDGCKVESMSKEFQIGDRVRVIALPPYLKTAEPMPSLRPAHLIQIGEQGIVMTRKPGGYWGVRFDKGAFLIDPEYIEVVADHSSSL